jgi:hypothetical protein
MRSEIVKSFWGSAVKLGFPMALLSFRSQISNCGPFWGSVAEGVFLRCKPAPSNSSPSPSDLSERIVGGQDPRLEKVAGGRHSRAVAGRNVSEPCT